MAALNPSTIRRLQKLKQVPSVWEGDRRPMSADSSSSLDPDAEATGECVIWVDGSQGMVRAMDMVSSDTGPEVIVRTLLKAIEYPQSPAPVVLPQKIGVKDREIQFFRSLHPPARSTNGIMSICHSPIHPPGRKILP